jgi:AcrR family transcriptional regulator
MAPRPRNGRTNSELVLAALLSARRVEDVAESLNTSKRTIYRYLADKNFQQMFETAKARLLDEAILKLRNEATRAVDVLVEVAQDKYANSAARVAAARSIIQFAVETGQVQELERKVQEMAAITIDAVAHMSNAPEWNSERNGWHSDEPSDVFNSTEAA